MFTDNYTTKCSLEVQYLKESSKVQGNKERKQKQVHKRPDSRFSNYTQNTRFNIRKNMHLLQLIKERNKENSQRCITKSNIYLLNLGPVSFSLQICMTF